MKNPLTALVLLCLLGLYAIVVLVGMQSNPHVQRVVTGRPNALPTVDGFRERAIEAVVATWSECTVLYFLHISKTGGTHINACIDAIKENDPDIHFKQTKWGLRRKKADDVARWLGWGSYSRWLNCVKEVKSQGSGHCTALQEPWRRNKVIVSTESSFNMLWSNVLKEKVPIGPELSNGTCFFSIVQEPVSWMQSAYNHALRASDLSWFMLHVTNNFQSAYFEDIAHVARWLTLFTTDRVDIVYEALKRLLELDSVPEVCNPAFDGNGSNVMHASSSGYDKSVDWSEWVRRYNGVDMRLYDVLKSEHNGFLHIVAPEAQTVGSVRSAASFFDVVKDFQWENPPGVQTYKEYIQAHRNVT